MNFKEFINGSYPSSAPLVDQESSINLYPELIAGDAGAPSEQWILRRTPGAKLAITLTDSPIRGMFTVAGRMFVVAGFSFFELQWSTGTTFTATLRGTLAIVVGLQPVSMKCNGVEICIIADFFGYIFNLNTAVFSTITAPAFPAFSATTVAMIDTYFLVNYRVSGSNQFVISGALAGLSWSALDFGSSQEPDVIVALAELHLSLWIFGLKRIVIFQNTGAASFPFQRVPGAAIDMGLAARLSVQNLDNTLFWLGANEAGGAVVYRADGMLPSRVSTHAVEYAMQTYSTVADAVGSSYQEEGHLFYRLDFPTANATWVYDVSTRRWHQRGLWNSGTSLYGADPARFHTFWSGFHVVGDYRSGAVYIQALDYPDWAGAAIRWLRRAPHIVVEGRARTFYRTFEIVFGVSGSVTSATAMLLRWSDDGGATWASSHSMTPLAPGDYTKRIVFRRLGSARSRVFELSGTDPLPRLAIAAAELQLEKGSS